MKRETYNPFVSSSLTKLGLEIVSKKKRFWVLVISHC